MAGMHPEVLKQLEKYKEEPKPKKGEPGWTLNSRNLIAACLFGKMGMAVPRNAAKDKLPSIAAPQLEKCSHPFAGVLKEWKSKAHTVSSIKSATGHIRDAEAFGQTGGRRARIVYNVINFGNVERVFTKAEESVPISADKRVRYALAPSDGTTVDTAQLRPSILAMLPQHEVYESGEDSV